MLMYLCLPERILSVLIITGQNSWYYRKILKKAILLFSNVIKKTRLRNIYIIGFLLSVAKVKQFSQNKINLLHRV